MSDNQMHASCSMKLYEAEYSRDSLRAADAEKPRKAAHCRRQEAKNE